MKLIIPKNATIVALFCFAHASVAGTNDVYWSPTKLAGTVIWLDASDTNTLWADTNGTTQATTTVGRWDDKSGSGNHFYQDDGGKQPNGTTSGRTINGLNALDFDSDEMYSSGSAFGATLSDVCLFLVTYKDAGGERWDEYIDIGGDAAWHLELSSWGNPDYRPMFITAGGNNLQVNTYLANVADGVDLKDRVSLFGLYDSVSDDVKQIWIDGALGNESTSPGSTTRGADPDMFIGQIPDVGRASFDGLFGEVIAIDGTVTTNERQTVEGYLAWKWEFVDRLSSNHLYKYAIPGLPVHFSDLAASNITTTSAVLYATSHSNLTSGAIVWDTSDQGATNVTDWTGTNSISGSTPGLVSGTATNLSPDTTYYYRFYGTNAVSNGWSLTTITFATDLTVANLPAFATATSTHNSVTLTWVDNSDTESGFVLQRSTNGSSFTQLTVVGPNVTNYVDQAVAVGRTYYYRLAATNTLNESGTDFTACETNAPPTALSGDLIFYESFEEPVVDGQVTTMPTGWESVTGNDAGISDSDSVSGKTGDQFGWVFRNGGTLLITNLSHTLGTGTNYTLTCDLTFSRMDGDYATVALLAGTNVIAVSTNVYTSANDLTAQSVSLSFQALPGNPYLGEPLGIRLSGDYWHPYFDDLALTATDTSTDNDAPTPGTMAWIGLPTSSVSNSITMQATNAIDVNGVEYFFTNTINGNVSGWQASQIWSDTGLVPGVTYSYRVKARDKSANTNETNWSPIESAECEQHIILYESFETPSIRPNTFLTFDDSDWFLPPEGWAGGGSSTRAVIHDLSSSWPVETPYGEQWAGMRENTYIETTSALNSYILEAGYTYRVTFHTGCAGERSGEENGVPGDNKVELIAGSTVVASNIVSTTLDDFSETNRLEFVAAAGHANLGETLKVRLTADDTSAWWRYVIFDQVKVYAIPSGRAEGTLFQFR